MSKLEHLDEQRDSMDKSYNSIEGCNTLRRIKTFQKKHSKSFEKYRDDEEEGVRDQS
jgi:hypothetical protein